jgi:hypothetical protein
MDISAAQLLRVPFSSGWPDFRMLYIPTGQVCKTLNPFTPFNTFAFHFLQS